MGVGKRVKAMVQAFYGRVASYEEVLDEKGDELATDLILEMARCLGTAVTSVCHVIAPSIVLLGGAMTFGRMETEIGKQFISTVRSEFQKRAFPVLAEKITIDYASLGGSAGFIGAAGCARRAGRHGLLK